ncbi:AI-2E family transporter [Caenimonas terrae]|uniref:AI-2E family transporter n=1 Tax=Caenimonas terrae TaxID=696074 RepID=A0ABW0NCE8_9BURK
MPTPLNSPELQNKVFLALLVLVTVAFGLIIWPFNGAIWWAIFIAIVFLPLHRRLLRRFGPQRATLAALATLGITLVVAILPLVLLTVSVTQEAAAIYGRVKSGELNPAQYFQQIVDSLPAWLRQLAERFGLLDVTQAQRRFVASLSQSGQALTAQALSIGQTTFDFLVSFFLMLYLLFFLLRDGPALSSSIVEAMPLQRHRKRQLFDKFVTVVRATVKGNILVALIQGALGGLALGFLGVPGAMLWGAVMAMLSLLPAIGAAIVWLPVAIWLLVTGSLWQGFGLIAWGVLVIGLVDNLLRPVLVGKDTQLPDYLVLFSTLGGMAIFGLNGFVIGPVIAAMFVAAWDIFAKAEREDGAAGPAG